MSRIANNALLGGGVRVRVWIREQRKIKTRSKVLLSLCWQSWTSLAWRHHNRLQTFLGLKGLSLSQFQNQNCQSLTLTGL